MTGSFELSAPPLLSRSAVVRDERVRTDTARLRSGWEHALLLRVDARGRVAADDGALRLDPAAELGPEPPADAVFLGVDDGADVWAIAVPWLPDAPGDGPVATVDLRTGGPHLAGEDAGLLATATALLGWHAKAGYCSVCGQPTNPELAGWARRCAAGHEEYPRTDPAVICLVHDGADQVLLGRQPSWPVGRFSVLAGFVEAGESLEACVQREVREEVGVTVRDVRYLGSQPWPFPRSIMLGFHATADPAEPVLLRDGEIAEAYWFSRDEIRAALQAGDWTGHATGQRPLLLPGSVSIARGMLESWVAR